MSGQELTREEMIETFAPARAVLQVAIDHARAMTTLERFAKLHPEIQREAGLKRLSGQARWMLIADGLVSTISSVDGFGVLSTEAQHNSGQYVFACPGGAFTVKREPHDETDPDDGRYIQEALPGIREQAPLAAGIDSVAPIIAYLAVTRKSAVLKICHATLLEPMKIPVDDLIPLPISQPSSADRPRARARSARKSKDQAQRPTVDGKSAD
jgi:hypothetical protein